MVPIAADDLAVLVSAREILDKLGENPHPAASWIRHAHRRLDAAMKIFYLEPDVESVLPR
jgi:hypothetical protein